MPEQSTVIEIVTISTLLLIVLLIILIVLLAIWGYNLYLFYQPIVNDYINDFHEFQSNIEEINKKLDKIK